MARIPFNRLADTPPYVARSSADKVLRSAGDSNAVVIIVGDGPARGVTRTVRTFVRQAPDMVFADNHPRHAVVLDLYGITSYDPAEVLAIVRNAVVKLVNDLKGLSSVGSYLLPFDALYTLWIRHARLQIQDVTGLVPTARMNAGKALARLALKLAAFDVVEVLGGIQQIAAAVSAGGFAARVAGDLGRESAVERISETLDVQTFIRRFIAPTLSPRLRAALDEGLSEVRTFCFPMRALLSDAIAKVQRDLAKQGKMIITVDAIDEAAGADKNTVKLRSNVCSLFSDPEGEIDWMGGVLCGRGPVELWRRETDLRKPRFESLGAMEDERLIHVAFRNAGLEEGEVEKLLSGLTRPIYAGHLSETCDGVCWPASRL